MPSSSSVLRRGAVLAASAALAGLGFASPALAQGPGSNNPQDVTGNVQVNQTLTLALSGYTSFTIGGNVGQTFDTYSSGPTGSLIVNVISNDPGGYFTDIQGPAAFSGSLGGGANDTFPANDMSYDTANDGGGLSPSWSPLPGTAHQLSASGTISAASGDNFFTGFQIRVPNVDADLYTGTIALTLFGN